MDEMASKYILLFSTTCTNGLPNYFHSPMYKPFFSSKFFKTIYLFALSNTKHVSYQHTKQCLS